MIRRQDSSLLEHIVRGAKRIAFASVLLASAYAGVAGNVGCNDKKRHSGVPENVAPEFTFTPQKTESVEAGNRYVANFAWVDTDNYPNNPPVLTARMLYGPSNAVFTQTNNYAGNIEWPTNNPGDVGVRNMGVEVSDGDKNKLYDFEVTVTASTTVPPSTTGTGSSGTATGGGGSNGGNGTSN